MLLFVFLQQEVHKVLFGTYHIRNINNGTI